MPTQVDQSLDTRRLELIILPTEKCNFRCTYCYEDFQVGRMSPSTVIGIKSFLARRVPQVSTLVLSWFGGEPLLAPDLIFDIGAYANALAQNHSVKFRAGLTTNAYLLTSELFSRLLDIDHRAFQITLDGDAACHDETRVRADSRGTFHTIWENLIGYKKVVKPFLVTLRLHLHRENIESMKRLYATIASELLTDHRFSVHFHKIVDHSKGAGIPQGVLSDIEFAEAQRYVTGARNSTRRRRRETAAGVEICYAARPNSFLIRANGSLGKCTVALGDPRNDLGSIREDGTLVIKQDVYNLWLEGYEPTSSASLSCPLSTLRPASELVQIQNFEKSSSSIARFELRPNGELQFPDLDRFKLSHVPDMTRIAKLKAALKKMLIEPA